MDGGTVWDINVESAVNQCLELVESEADIIVDVIIVGTPEKAGYQVSKNAMENWQDAKSIGDFYSDMNEIESALAAFPDVERRYYIQDGSLCDVTNLLDFNNSTTWCLQMAGR